MGGCITATKHSHETIVDEKLNVFFILKENAYDFLITLQKVCYYLSKHKVDMVFIEPMHRNKPNITYFLLV